MRKLIYIPIIHSEVDMGSMAGPLKQQFISRFGPVKWREHARTVDDMWSGIKDKIKALNLDYKKAKIYQDGLPLCGKEPEIVADVAKMGSHNYSIILEMIGKGAGLIGTEDAKLLVEEYNFVKNLVSIPEVKQREEAVKKARKRRDELLAERDKYIAGRIKETLKRGETGILFSGIEHEVDQYLPRDIKVEYLIYRLPFRAIQHT